MSDSAAGKLEFPGGHIEDGETPLQAAQREWEEETGLVLPEGFYSGGWESPNDIYAGFVLTIEREADLNIFARTPGTDPDGDGFETLAWVSPGDLVGNNMVRAELAADLSLVLAALSATIPAAQGAGDADSVEVTPAPVEPVEPVTEAPTASELVAAVLSGDDVDPKAPSEADDSLAKGWRDGPADTPQMRYDLVITDHYVPAVQAAMRKVAGAIDVKSIMAAAGGDLAKKSATEAEDDAIRAKVLRLLPDDVPTEDLESAIKQILFDGYLSGLHSAQEQVGAHALMAEGIAGDAAVDTDWSAWKPGSATAADIAGDGGMAAMLDDLSITVKGVADTALQSIGNTIADGVRAGTAPDTVARSLVDLVGSVSRAELIAHTETARALTAASMSIYRTNGVTEWDLLTSAGACATCLAIAAANPHRVSDSSGTPPVHPRCRCSSSPVASSVVPVDQGSTS